MTELLGGGGGRINKTAVITDQNTVWKDEFSAQIWRWRGKGYDGREKGREFQVCTAEKTTEMIPRGGEATSDEMLENAEGGGG